MNEVFTPLIDTHCHLGMLEHGTSEEILARAKDAGITRMVTVSVDEPSWGVNRKFAEHHDHVFYSVGLHPHEAKDWRDCRDRMKALAPAPKCVAIGEMGLDFYYNHSDREAQIEAFEEQLEFAKGVGLPIIIHCRDAFDDLFSIIRKKGLGPAGGVMHCFTGGPPDAKDAVDLGLHISFSGIVTFKNAETLREAARIIPEESILVETDCPFLAPVPHRGKPNEPSFLPHTLQQVAAVRKVDPQALAEKTTENAVRFFSLP